MMRLISALTILFSITMLNSCGKSADEEVTGAILSANISLSKGDCQSAIDTLTAISYQSRNASFLKTLSAAYACRSGFSVVHFFASDIAVSASKTGLGGLTLYSTSLSTVTGVLENDSSFSDLQRAIDILLYAGGLSTNTEPTVSERAKYFGSKDASEINSQLAFMLLAQIGKYMHFYADTSTTGVKGAGTGANNCFSSYSQTSGVIQGLITGNASNTCKSTTSSHPQLDVASVSQSLRTARMCRGVVLLNNLLEVLPSVLASASGGDLSSVSGLTDPIKLIISAAGASLPNVATVMSQTNCVANAVVTAGSDELETYLGLIYENIML
jgi:hypothetical protein